MPKENIDRAIKRGTGEGKDTAEIERITYEGYASNGIAVMVDCLTENRNRTVRKSAMSFHTAAAAWPSWARFPAI